MRIVQPVLLQTWQISFGVIITLHTEVELLVVSNIELQLSIGHSSFTSTELLKTEEEDAEEKLSKQTIVSSRSITRFD